MRTFPLFLSLLLAGTLVACDSPSPRGPSSDAIVGDPAPELSLQWLDDSPAGSLADLRGRVVLLEFWRTW